METSKQNNLRGLEAGFSAAHDDHCQPRKMCKKKVTKAFYLIHTFKNNMVIRKS